MRSGPSSHGSSGAMPSQFARRTGECRQTAPVDAAAVLLVEVDGLPAGVAAAGEAVGPVALDDFHLAGEAIAGGERLAQYDKQHREEATERAERATRQPGRRERADIFANRFAVGHW